VATSTTPSSLPKPASTSLADSLSKLDGPSREQILDGLSDEQALALRHDWHFWARPNQLPPPGAWTIWLLLSGRGFGKTRSGAEWVREQVRDFEFVNLIGATADDARDIMIEGESGILACCPESERPEYLPSKRRLDWPNGAVSLIFTADEPERLRGKQHARVWADEIAAWRYPESWTQMILGLRLGDDARCMATSTPKPIPLLRELVAQAETGRVVITKGTTYENVANLAPNFMNELILQYEGTRLGRQELEAELLLDEGLAYPWSRERHVVAPFEVPDWWDRFEGFDHGKTHAACWLAFATDGEGNHICHSCYYGPGDVSDHAAAILKLRGKSKAICFADPSIRNSYGNRDWKGREVSVELEYNDHGLYFAPGQNDRRAGYARLSESLKIDTAHVFPSWHERAGEQGAPRVYLMDKPELEPLMDQIRDAPIEDPDSPLSRWPGEAVDGEWEGRSGHAHAAARYALMSRQRASVEPERPPEDPRARLMWEHEKRMTQPTRYEWS
jgi:hypothetical protein